MSENCLITRLKGVVNNDELPKYGYLVGEEIYSEDIYPYANSISGIQSGSKVFLTKGSFVWYNTGITYVPGVMYDNFDTSLQSIQYPVQMGTTNKYEVVRCQRVNITSIKYSKKVEKIHNVICDVPIEESDSIISSLKTIIEIEGISYIGIEGLKYSNLEKCVADNIYYGDLSQVNENLYYLWSSAGNFCVPDKCQWTNSSPRNWYICALMYINLGDNLDNYLISNASATLGKSPKASDKYSGNAIKVYGARTSASDSAIMTLKI